MTNCIVGMAGTAGRWSKQDSLEAVENFHALKDSAISLAELKIIRRKMLARNNDQALHCMRGGHGRFPVVRWFPTFSNSQRNILEHAPFGTMAHFHC